MFHGAEAIVEKKDNKVIKTRPKKGYRIKELDESIRKSRTNREVKVLQKLEDKNIDFIPKLLRKENYKIIMSEINGEQLDKIINKKNYSLIAKDLAIKIKLMHKKDIIHGDLTTANILVGKKDNNLYCYIIDFGLSYFSAKVEDKAVDLHVFQEVIESTFDFGENFMIEFLKIYKDKEVEKRLIKVNKRGKNKGKSD